MNKILLFFVFSISLLVLQSCKKEPKICDTPTVPSCTGTKFHLGIDVQSEFDKELVEIKIDGQTIYNCKTSTSGLTGLAKSLPIEYCQGSVQIEVSACKVHKTETFTLDKNKYIGIQYNKSTKMISLVYSDTPFMYE